MKFLILKTIMNKYTYTNSIYILIPLNHRQQGLVKRSHGYFHQGFPRGIFEKKSQL